jgi:hypothetical protein
VGRVRDGLVAGSVGAVLGGVPSSVYGVATGTLEEPTLAAGSMLLPDEQRADRLVAAAVPVHLGLSLGWGVILAHVLPRRRPVTEGVLAGAIIAVVDLMMGRRVRRRVAGLPLAPQVADHLAYAITVALTLCWRRGSRSSGPDEQSE